MPPALVAIDLSNLLQSTLSNLPHLLIQDGSPLEGCLLQSHELVVRLDSRPPGSAQEGSSTRSDLPEEKRLEKHQLWETP